MICLASLLDLPHGCVSGRQVFKGTTPGSEVFDKKRLKGSDLDEEA